MGGSLKRFGGAPLCSSNIEVVWVLPSSSTSKSSFVRPEIGSPLLLVTTTSTATSRTLVFNVGTDGPLLWAFGDCGEAAGVMQKTRKRTVEGRNILRRLDPEPYHKECLSEGEPSTLKTAKGDIYAERQRFDSNCQPLS